MILEYSLTLWTIIFLIAALAGALGYVVGKAKGSTVNIDTLCNSIANQLKIAFKGSGPID